MTVKATVSNRAIAKSGHINTVEQLKKSDIGGFSATNIVRRSTPRLLNNIVHSAGGTSETIPKSLSDSAAYEEFEKLITALFKGLIDYVTIYSPDGTLLSDHYYSTSRSLRDARDNEWLGVSDDIIILARHNDRIFLTWGSYSAKKSAGVGIKIDKEDFDDNDTLYGALYDVFVRAYDDGRDYIDLDLSDNLRLTDVIVQGHTLDQNKYVQLQIEEFLVAPPKISQDITDVKEEVQTNETKEETSKMKTTLSAVIAENKAAAINAGEMETGRLVVNRIVAVVKKRAPLMIKGYIDTPVGRIVVANLFATLVREYMPDNALAGRAADGAVKSAAYEVLRDIDIPAMIEEVLAGFKEAEPAAAEKVAI